ncbi:hypothetical protein PoB_006520200 [Plakobranchus ocellatus]|uniref:Uncharacterized protein n=1 Tax=Plakobranchus ocellatus TaxID=259542 RepID=A0AAV4D3C7_9GAST|nr:hypothetical protein PoB_006520200 [Plakobranchus ocellatus]
METPTNLICQPGADVRPGTAHKQNGDTAQMSPFKTKQQQKKIHQLSFTTEAAINHRDVIASILPLYPQCNVNMSEKRHRYVETTILSHLL